jgi:hypothetical protein
MRGNECQGSLPSSLASSQLASRRTKTSFNVLNSSSPLTILAQTPSPDRNPSDIRAPGLRYLVHPPAMPENASTTRLVPAAERLTPPHQDSRRRP